MICGARETKDAHCFQALERVGLEPDRLRGIEGKVLALCRDRISPSIAPLVEELPAATPDRRILVFVQPATGSAQQF